MASEMKPAIIWKFSALAIASLLPAVLAGCAQQPSAQPAAAAQVAAKLAAAPRAKNQMQIVMTKDGDVPTPPINGDGQPLVDIPGHQTRKDHTYDFGAPSSGAEVCFWDEARPTRQFCWPNSGSAWIFLNPQGDITHAQQASGQSIPPGNHNAVMTKNWYYGPGTPYCFWTALGGCYCWDV